jgi:para-aminobenzoate synthetase component 1
MPAQDSLSRFDPRGVAARCRRLRLSGLVWLDSALADDARAVSIVAACPEHVSRGEAADWPRFESELADFQRRCPLGAALGWVEYGGDFCFGFYPALLLYHHRIARWTRCGGSPAWLPEALALPPDALPVWDRPLHFIREMDSAGFCRRVEQARAHIAAGDIYQVNLAHRLSAPWPEAADPFALYLALREASPAPQAAFLELGGRAALCSSPEEFLRLDGRRARTRPIKGTRPRASGDSARDAANSRELLASAKERAELLMITDLLRNDLGRISEYGSVRVPELLRLERFAQVFHLVSTVKSRLRADITHAAALRACLPGGSITGAPKKRAREIIATLEPKPRGLYTGSIGAFGPGRRSRFNIAIRTLIVEAGVAHFHVGAGIVADSAPEAEWEETLHKAAGILRAAAGPLAPAAHRGEGPPQ